MQQHQHPLLAASLGAQHTVSSFHFGSAEPDAPKVYIQASLHADEMPGMLVAWHLKQALQTLESRGQIHGEIILVPQANPLGHDQTLLGTQIGRFNLASGENFNRHYPDLAREVYQAVREQLGPDAQANTRLIRAEIRRQLAAQTARTELESLRLKLLSLAADADIVLDLHCDYNAALHVYTGTPLWPACEPLSRYLGSHAQLLATESGDNPFDEACSQTWWKIESFCKEDGLQAPIEMGCLAVTIELRGQDHVSHPLAQQDSAAILNFLRYRGVLTDAPAPALAELPYPATPLAGSENLDAPHPGVLCFHVQPGERVEVGQPVADVIDPISDRASTLCSEYGGMVYALEVRHYATTNMAVAKIATQQAFKTGKLLSA